MTHRGALYMVQVRPKWHTQDFRPLGDIDQAGTSLIDWLDTSFSDFEWTRADGERQAVCTAREFVDDDELFLSFEYGETGLVAEIRRAGKLRYRQSVDDTQFVRCAALFQLRDEETLGWLAVHINGGRGIKGPLGDVIIPKFRTRFDDLLLLITPFVSASAFYQAVTQSRIEQLRLIRYEKPNDRSFDDTQKWVRKNTIGRVVLEVSAPRGQSRLKPDLVRRFLGGNEDLIHEIVQFDGLEFDEADVTVTLPNGARRTFNIQQTDSGHPLTVDLEDLEFDEDDRPTQDSLVTALRTALEDAQ
jgi:hypothetical protein